MPKFEHFLEADEDDVPVCLRPTILEEIVKEMRETVRRVVEDQSQYPKQYVEEYGKYMYLINGEADSEFETYLSETRKFEEMSEKVKHLDDLHSVRLAKLPKEAYLFTPSLQQAK